METPKKRVKATGTQETKVTSTPEPGSQNMEADDLSISSIVSTVFEQEKPNKSDFYYFGNNTKMESSASEAASMRSVYESKHERFLYDLRKIQYTGTVWEIFKPIKENTIYHDVLLDPTNTNELSKKLLHLYSKKPEQVVLKLLNFFTDLSNYQNLKINSIYTFETPNPSAVVDFMSNNIDPNLNEHNKYLFSQSRGKLSVILKVAIYNFLEKLVVNAHTFGILYDDFFPIHILKFITDMASRPLVRAIRHTGAILAIKFVTSCVIVYDLNSTTAEQRTILDKYFEFLLMSFRKICLLQDKKCASLREEYAREMGVWIKKQPNIFINEWDMIRFLKKLVVDESRDVRLAALGTCKKIIENRHLHHYIHNVMKELLNTIIDRFADVDNAVCIKALETFKVVIDNYPSFIGAKEIYRVFLFIYYDNFSVAQAAAKVVITFVRLDKPNQKEFVKNIAQLATSNNKISPYKPLLVEACLEQAEEFQNWGLLLKLIIEENEDYESGLLETLLELTLEAIFQTLTGKSSMLRKFPRTDKLVNGEDHADIARVVYPNLKTLLKMFHESPKILNQILSVIELINCEDLGESYNKKYFNEIFQCLENIFFTQTDDKLLVTVANALLFFCSSNFDYNKRSMALTNKITTKLVQKLLDDLALQAEDLSSQDFSSLEENSKKVSLLFERFDLTNLIDLPTHILLGISNEAYDKIIIQNLVVCNQWYLVWSLRNLIKQSANARGVEEKNVISASIRKFLKYCDEFRDYCFNMMEVLNNEPLHYTIFNSLCQFHRDFANELRDLLKSDHLFMPLFFQIDKNDWQNDMVSFLEKHVVDNTKLPIYERRSYFVRINELVFTNVLPPQFLCHIYKYYHSHNEEFGVIIERTMKKLQEQRTLYVLVTYTLTEVYKLVEDFMGEDGKKLKYLTKQFATSEFFKSSPESAKLLFLAMEFVSKSGDNYEFLNYARYFLANLTAVAKRDIVDCFKKTILKQGGKHPSVIYFKKDLDTKTKPGPKKIVVGAKSTPKKKVTQKKPSSTEESEGSSMVSISGIEEFESSEDVTQISLASDDSNKENVF